MPLYWKMLLKQKTPAASRPRGLDYLASIWALMIRFSARSTRTCSPRSTAQTRGRPNFPVNILICLEAIKHLFDYTDEEILEQYSYNYQVNYAVGILTLGELPLAERTFYEFRERVFKYTLEHPGEADLIFKQFEILLDSFIKITNTSAIEQRTDSTFITPNIRRAGRLSLARVEVAL
jgi:hypothetical protein